MTATYTRNTALTLSTVAVSLALVSCGQSASDTATDASPISEPVTDHADPVSSVPVSGEPAGRLAALATDAASFKGQSGDLVIRLNDLDQAAQKTVPNLPADVREMINGDLQSMRDAVDANDWPAAQEAAAAIAETLNQAN